MLNVSKKLNKISKLSMIQKLLTQKQLNRIKYHDEGENLRRERIELLEQPKAIGLRFRQNKI